MIPPPDAVALHRQMNAARGEIMAGVPEPTRTAGEITNCIAWSCTVLPQLPPEHRRTMMDAMLGCLQEAADDCNLAIDIGIRERKP